MSYLVFVPQDIITNAALCQPGWRETNARAFYPERAVQAYWSAERVGLDEPSTEYSEMLREIGKKLVIKDDTFGVVQRGGS